MRKPRPLRKRKTQDPCLRCYLHKARCICALIPRLNLNTKVTLVVHHRELRHTTNTGRLALLALTSSEMRVRGEDKTPLDLSDLINPYYRTFLLYPSEDALPLNHELVMKSDQPIQLIVPDGSWRQASKIHYRHKELNSLPRVMLVDTPHKEAQVMRKETKEHGMSTIQAIAFALGIIESKEVEKKLLEVYHAKLEQTLRARGMFFNDDSLSGEG